MKELRELFIKYLSQDSQTQDMRRKEFNQAIFIEPSDKFFGGRAVFNGTDLAAPARLAYNQTLPGKKDTVSTLVWADWLIHNTTDRTGVTVLVKVW